MKIENASTFSQVTFSQFPLCSPPECRPCLVITCTLCHPSPSPASLSISRPIGGMSLDTEADLTPAHRRCRHPAPASPLRPAFTADSIYSAMRLVLRHAHPHLTSSHSSLRSASHNSHPHPSILPPFLLSPHSLTLQPILKTHVNDELG